MQYILALDQGTTSSRSVIFNADGCVVSFAQKELSQIYPNNGWVEHDPEEIWSSQIDTAREAMEKVGLSVRDIAACGITNQRETTVLWDRATGRPIHNAIVWQDRRTSAFCDEMRSAHGDVIREKTGLEVDAYFSASKINWLLQNVDAARQKAVNGDLCFGTVDTWLMWRLTGGLVHATDVSNASRTMLFNINSLEWDDELLGIFEIPRSILPSVRSSSEVFGEISTVPQLNGLAIASVAGDQQAALFGQACFRTGDTKNTYGTGCFMLQNVGEKPLSSEHRLLSTVGWQVNGHTEYALAGSVFIGGAVVQWLRDALGIIDASKSVEALAAAVSDNGGVYFVPAFTGLGTPHWDQDARGLIIGLTRGTGREHIARAAVESIAFQTAALLTAMRADSNASLSELRVDGGAAGNAFLLQFQADILQIPVVRSAITETTALGTAYLAGLATGFWRSTDELAEHWKVGAKFHPSISQLRSDELMSRWNEAVTRSLNWNK